MIKSPRPFYVEDEKPKGVRTIYLGTKISGNVIRISKEGIEINGYYEGFRDEDHKYATLRQFAKISWEDLQKMREDISRKKKRKIEISEEPDDIEEVDESYLKRLPIVTLNGIKFYIDIERRERRPVDNPSFVFNFKQIFERE